MSEAKTSWSKLLPILVAGMVLGAAGYSITNKEAKAGQNIEVYSKTEIDERIKRYSLIDIELLKRIEAIEKKIKLVPPKDSIKLVKNEKTP